MLKRGFTLIELMVVVGMITILATISLFGLAKSQAAGRDSSRVQTMTAVQAALERYYSDNQYYPVNVVAPNQWGGPINTLVTAGNLATTPTDTCKGSTAINGDGTLAGGVCSPTKYAYIGLQSDGVTPCSSGIDCQKYSLQLTKESGGSTTLTSPQ